MTTEDTHVEHRRLELQIKRQTLYFESVYIKDHEEVLRRRIQKRLAKGKLADKIQAQRESIHNHRMNVIRPEARAAHLAACFLRGVPYERIEDPQVTRSNPDWDRVRAIVGSFSSLGGNAIKDGVETWWGGPKGSWATLNRTAIAARVGTRASRARAHDAESAKRREEATAS